VTTVTSEFSHRSASVVTSVTDALRVTGAICVHPVQGKADHTNIVSFRLV
jgi:hypothetical protein